MVIYKDIHGTVITKGKLDIFIPRGYLKTGNMLGSQGFFRVQAIFSQEYLVYFKERWCCTGEKDRLFGHVDGFQIDPITAANETATVCFGRMMV